MTIELRSPLSSCTHTRAHATRLLLCAALLTCYVHLSHANQPRSLVHPFHKQCILSWARISNTCPLCKKRFVEVCTPTGPSTRVEHVRWISHDSQLSWIRCRPSQSRAVHFSVAPGGGWLYGMRRERPRESAGYLRRLRADVPPILHEPTPRECSHGRLEL